MRVTGIDEEIARLEQMGRKAMPVFREAVYVGAGIVADEVRNRLERNLRDRRTAALHPNGRIEKSTEPTGDLLDSLGITPVGVDKDGVINAKIGFSGYDRKGVPNQLKARAMESGTSTLRKRPFMRPAGNASRRRAVQAAGAVIRDGLLKLKMKGEK